MDFKKYLKKLEHCPTSYSTLPEDLKKDIDFQIAAVKINPVIFQYINDPCNQVKIAAVNNFPYLNQSDYHPLQDMKNPTYEILMIAVENSPHALKYIENQEEFIEKSITRWPGSIEYVKEQTEEIAWLALEQTTWTLKYIKNPSYDMCLYAVRKSPYIISNVPNEYKTEELCWIAISKSSTSLLSAIPNPCDDMIRATLSKDGNGLQYVTNPTMDLCELAIQTTSYAIEFVPQNLLTETMCWQALRTNVNLFAHTFQTREMCEYVLQYDGHLIKYIEDPDEDLCIQAVKTSPFALRYIENQTDDVVKMALSVTGMAIKHVKIQNPEMCLLAVQQDGTALAYVREKTKDICLQAFETDGFALKNLDPEEMSLELCQAAVRQNPWAIEFVPTEYVEALDVPSEVFDILFGNEADPSVLIDHPWCAATDVFCVEDIGLEIDTLLHKEPRLTYYLRHKMYIMEFVEDSFFEKYPFTNYYMSDQFVEDYC